MIHSIGLEIRRLGGQASYIRFTGRWKVMLCSVLSGWNSFQVFGMFLLGPLLFDERYDVEGVNHLIDGTIDLLYSPTTRRKSIFCGPVKSNYLYSARMKNICRTFFYSVLIGLGFCAPRLIGESIPSTAFASEKLTLEDHFHAGRFEVALGGGTLFSPIGHPKNRPTVNYALGEVQFGLMLTDPGGPGIFRGNLEFVPEAFGASIYDGRGNYLAGGTVWFRYNFIPPDWRVIPYVQAGGGGVLTDIDRRYVGEHFNFNLGAAAGFRFFICPRSTVNLEYRYQHISNANLGRRNIGVNAHGPVLSFSWFF
jgi:lipid A 3-O-deacylase